MALFHISMQEFALRRSRTILTVLSIAIGVGAILSVLISTEASKAAQRGMIDALSVDVSMEIKSEGGGLFSEEVFAKLKAVDGVESLFPSLRRFAVVTTPDGKQARVQLAGIRPDAETVARAFQIPKGRLYEEDEEVLLDEAFARSLGIELNDTVQFLTASGKQTGTIVGLLRPSKIGAATEGAVALIPIRTAQRWFRSRGKLDTIQIRLKSDADFERVEQQCRDLLPAGLMVKRPGNTSRSAEEMLRAIGGGLGTSTTFGMIIAVFIIYNTFQMSIGERRRQIGILRAIGTTRGQIVRMILREGFLLGVAGILFGWVLGFFGAQGLTIMMESLLGADLPALRWNWPAVAIASGAGCLVTLIGILLPALYASRLPPADAMRTVSSQDFESISWPLTILGVVSFIGGVRWIQIGLQLEDPMQHANWGMAAILIAWILLLPAVLGPASRVMQWFLSPIFGPHVRLAQRQLMRHRHRSAMTIGVLFLAISSGLGLALVLLDNIKDVENWYRRSIVGDFFIRAAMPDMATGASADMPAEVQADLAKIEGVTNIDSIRFISVRSEDSTIVVVVREFNSSNPNYFDVVAGDRDRMIQQVREGGVVLGSVLAERMELKVGDTIPLQSLRGKEELPIVGVANDYLLGGMTVYMHRPQAVELFQVEGADAYIIDAAPSQLAQVEKRLIDFSIERGLMFQSYKDLITYIHGIINVVLASLWTLLALGTVIACFGLINTLAMSILEQTREIGLLRAIAMTRGQVRRLIASQAMLMATIAIVPGVPIGLMLAYLVNISSAHFTGHQLEFDPRPELVVLAVLAELLLAALAAIIPAQRAAQGPITQALQYE